MQTTQNADHATKLTGVCKPVERRSANVSVLSKITTTLSKCLEGIALLQKEKHGVLVVADIKTITGFQLELVTVLDMLTDLKYVAKKGDL